MLKENNNVFEFPYHLSIISPRLKFFSQDSFRTPILGCAGRARFHGSTCRSLLTDGLFRDG